MTQLLGCFDRSQAAQRPSLREALDDDQKLCLGSREPGSRYGPFRDLALMALKKLT